MTWVAVGLLVCAWVGYFAYALRDRRSNTTRRRDSTREFNRSLGALGGSVAGTTRASLARSGQAPARQPPPGDEAVYFPPRDNDQPGDPPDAGAAGARMPHYGSVLDRPLTRQEASRRRRNVVLGLVSIAVVCLLLVGALGTAAWVAFTVTLGVLAAFLALAMGRETRSR